MTLRPPRDRSRPRRVPALGLALGVVLAALAATGCRSTTVATQNLDTVLGSSDRFRYVGPTTTLWKDFVHNGVLRLGGIVPRKEATPEDKAIKNPSKLALANLRALAGAGEGRESWRQNEQVRLLTRYARTAPSQLCRERAVLELVPHAQRLGVDEPYVPLADAVANAPELIEALDGLVDASRGLLAAGGASSATARADFDAAVDVLEQIPVDIQGGSRLLRAIGPFMRHSRLPEPQAQRLEALSVDVQQRLVQEALWASASDTSPVVRAAGMRANIAVFGEPFAIEALFALVPRQLQSDGIVARHSRFRVPRVLPSQDEIYLEVCGAFEERGLPLAARLPDADSVELRLTIFAVLWQITINDLVFSGRVRNAAMRALGTVSGGDLQTLRAEEWDQWWRSVVPGLEAELNALRRLDAAP